MFQTKLDECQSDIDYFRQNCGRIEQLGDLSSLSHANQKSISLTACEKTLYDFTIYT